MKKLTLDLEALDVESYATTPAVDVRGTVVARNAGEDGIIVGFPITTDTEPTSFTYPDTWGTGPCTTAPSSDFPCYSKGCTYQTA